MPFYPYVCQDGHTFEVAKAISQIEREETCATCGKVAERGIALPAPVSTTAGDWNRVEYNPGLGQWTKSWKHGREIAKRKGLVEVGNTSVESIHKTHDQAREEKREQRYRDAANLK